jgi:hypothetical protein
MGVIDVIRGYEFRKLWIARLKMMKRLADLRRVPTTAGGILADGVQAATGAEDGGEQIAGILQFIEIIMEKQ